MGNVVYLNSEQARLKKDEEDRKHWAKISPAHYQTGNYQVIDFIEKFHFRFSIGNAVKYLFRAGRKDQEDILTDLNKALWYLQRTKKYNEETQTNQPYGTMYTTFFYDYVDNFNLHPGIVQVLYEICRLTAYCSIDNAITLLKEHIDGITNRKERS